MKRTLKHFFAQFGSSVLMVAICAYLVLQLTRGLGEVAEVEQTTYMTMQETLQLEAYLFRDETPLYSGSAGTNCFLAADGERVALGATVVITYANASDATVQERITNIDRQIRILQQSNLSAGALTTDLSILDQKIAELQVELLREVADDDLAKALRSEDELWIQLNRRRMLLGLEPGTYEARLTQLQQEKASLERTLTGASARATVSEAGYFYRSADGYETAFTMAALDNLTVSGFLELAHAEADANILREACGKLVHSEQWYVAVPVDRRTAGTYREGNTYSMLFPYSGGMQLSMVLDRRILQTDLDTAVLVFRSRELPEGFDFCRSQTVQLVVGDYAGIRVDADALRVLDGELGCYVLSGSHVVFKKADVLYRNEEFAICQVPYDSVRGNRTNKAYISDTYLSLYDTVILSASDLYVGKVLQ